MTAIVRTTGAINTYGTARPPTRRRRRDVPKSVAAAVAVLVPSAKEPQDWLSTDAMLSLADLAACWMLSLPVRICASMLRRMFPFSTSAQCFAVGTNQLRDAARSFTEEPRRLVAFGMLPFACSVFSELELVKSLIQS